MALIKCPECGKDVSTEASCCPHCGYPLHKDKLAEISESTNVTHPSKIEENVMYKKYQLKKRKILSIYLSIFVLSAIIATIMGCLIMIDFNYYWGLFLGATIAMLFIILFIITNSMTKIIYREMDGYMVIVFVMNKIYLSIDNEEIATSRNRFLNAKLPNGRDISVTVSLWDGSTKIDYC